MAHCRVALTQDGRRYIVQQVDLRVNVVHCWGPVVEYRNGKSKHGPSLHFPKAKVRITDEEKTPALLDSLFREHIRSLQAQGHVIVKRGRKNPRFVDLGKDAEMTDEAAVEAAE